MSLSYVVWGVLALGALLTIGLAVRAERKRFAARGKAGAWLWVRLISLPVALLAAGAVILLARSVGGPEALAAFYLLMFTLGPLIYFGLLWLAGLMAKPTLSVSESAAIGGSGLLIVILPAMLASMASPWVYQLGQVAQQAQRSLATETPLVHRITNRQRFLLPDIGEVLTEHWQAPPGVKVERVEWELGGQYLQTGDSTGSILCRDGEDFHVFRHATGPAPRWRMYWRDTTDSLHRSDWTSTPPEATVLASPLIPVWSQDGVAFPVRIPRNFVTVERRWVTGRVQQSDALASQTLPSMTDTCLPPTYRDHNAESQVTSIGVRMWLTGAKRMGVATFSRPPE